MSQFVSIDEQTNRQGRAEWSTEEQNIDRVSESKRQRKAESIKKKVCLSWSEVPGVKVKIRTQTCCYHPFRTCVLDPGVQLLSKDLPLLLFCVYPQCPRSCVVNFLDLLSWFVAEQQLPEKRLKRGHFLKYHVKIFSIILYLCDHCLHPHHLVSKNAVLSATFYGFSL